MNRPVAKPTMQRGTEGAGIRAQSHLPGSPSADGRKAVECGQEESLHRRRGLLRGFTPHTAGKPAAMW